MDPLGEVNEFNIIVNIVPVDISASVGAVESTDTALTKFGFHVQCGAVILRSIFSKNIHKRHTITLPLGRAMGCILWIQYLIDILPQFLQSFMQYLTVSDRVIMALSCTYGTCT